MILINDIPLIGDFIGTIPVMIELAKIHNGLKVIIPDDIVGLLELIPKEYKIQRIKEKELNEDVKELDLHGAFAFAANLDLHMIQSHYHFIGLPVPSNVPRPELEIPNLDVPVYDYVLAPFSRSLPPDQKWQQEKWQQLINILSGKTFALFGNSKYDDKNFVLGDNVTPEFDRPFIEVANIMKKSKGVISVTTGISHLCYALNVKNILMFNQGTWGRNPEAFLIIKYIPDISVEMVYQSILFNL